jgi:hypothetical protein
MAILESTTTAPTASPTQTIKEALRRRALESAEAAGKEPRGSRRDELTRLATAYWAAYRRLENARGVDWSPDLGWSHANAAQSAVLGQFELLCYDIRAHSGQKRQIGAASSGCV